MALRPLLRELLSDYRRPEDVFDQHYGLGLWDDDNFRPTTSLLSTPLLCGYVRPWRLRGSGDSGVSSIQSDKNEFKVNLDVQQFQPEELNVKVENGYLVVDGKHEERSDEHGFISRQFTRRYKIPEDVDEKTIISNLSSDGVLSLKAPKKTPPEAAGREIPIMLSNQPAVKDKKDKKEGETMEQ